MHALFHGVVEWDESIVLNILLANNQSVNVFCCVIYTLTHGDAIPCESSMLYNILCQKYFQNFRF